MSGVLPLFRFHPGHHLSLRGVQLALPPLARFLEVLVTSQIGENSCLLTLLLEPAKGTLEGFTFFHPDAGHPVYRLLTLVWVRANPPCFAAWAAFS